MIKNIFTTTVSNNALNFALLILRFGSGAFMLTHGYPKFKKLLAGNTSFSDPIGIGEETSFYLVVFAEFFCAILIMIGLGTRLASIPLIFAMIVAGFIRHADDPFATKEKALLFLLIFIVTLILGSGKFSVDHAIDKRLKR